MGLQFALGAVTGVALLIAAVFLYSRIAPSAVGDPSSSDPSQEEWVTPDLAGYTPPPGCVLDRIYREEDQVWSELLNRPIRPVTTEIDGEQQMEFPIDSYDVALNCHEAAAEVNPYYTPSPGPGDDCTSDIFYSVDGWVEGNCYGRLRPDIPFIFGEGDRVFISPPLGPAGEIIADGPPIDASPVR